jgi:hypothetical protein
MATSAPADISTKISKIRSQEFRSSGVQEFRSKPTALLPYSATPELLFHESLTSSQFFAK